MELKDLISYKLLEKKDTILFSQVTSVYEMVKETINSIAGCFNNYTMHDMGHGLRVATYMEQLAFGIDEEKENKANGFNAAELTILILSAILHDIGMFISPKDKEEIKSGKIKHSNSLTFQGVLDVKKGNEEEAVKEIIRKTHAARINDFLEFKFNGANQTISEILMIDNKYSYAEDIALICQAHGEDNYDFIKNRLRATITKGKYEYNPQFFAVLLRIADYLDLDKQRTPILWFYIMGIEGFSKSEWETHFQIHNEMKLKEYMDGKMQIYFDGESSNAKIHRKYLKYIDGLKTELENADSLLNTLTAKSQYRLNVSTKIDDCVQTKGFQYSDLRLSLDYTAITELLMGKNIYGDSRLGLRELIQNSIDACKLMREVGDEFSSPATPAIYLYYSKKNNYFMLKDTGVGMTLDIIRNHFLNIGKSYYKSSEYLFNNYKYKPIGQYGIGFLACFLLSNNVIVKTKHYKSNDVYQIELEKSSEYVVTRKEETPLFYGTEITLEYENFFNVFKSNDELKSFVQKYFLTDVPIYIKDNDSGEEKIYVENTCKKESESFFASKTNKLKIEEIVCSDFSKEFDGRLYLSAIKKRKNTEILDLSNKSIFLYDGQNKKINKVDVLPDGYYQYFQYPLISMEEYKKIAQTKKESERKMKEIIALGINNGQEALLFVNSKDRFPAPYMYDDFESEDSLKKVFEDSNLNYYNELLYYENHKYSFVSTNKLINVNSSIFTNNYRFRHYLSNKDYGPAYFYNKDILVRDFRGLRCNLPDEYDIFGYINYLGQKIKLDVSRNEIIEGYPDLFKEFTLIILQYKILQEKNLEIKHFLEKMLDFTKSKEI